MSAADVDVRWRREWLAIGTGTILLLVVLLLLAAGEGFRVLPEDIAGRARPEARVWLALALAVVLALPAVLAWLSGRPAWLLTGAGALLGGLAVTLLLGTALPAVFDSATVTATFAIGVIGAAALRNDRSRELVGRALVVVVLVAASWLLTRAGIFDPLPLLMLTALGMADRLSASARG